MLWRAAPPLVMNDDVLAISTHDTLRDYERRETVLVTVIDIISAQYTQEPICTAFIVLSSDGEVWMTYAQ
jgi:hypothetical protein